MLQDYGRARGISMDALTFTHRVIYTSNVSQKDDISKLLQKRLNIVRRAFQVVGAKETGKGPAAIL